jgi:hypothetical protein
MTPRPKPERPRKDAMKNRDAPYFPLSLDSLRAIGGWAADGALALELDGLGHSAIGDAVVRLLVQQAPPAVRDVLRQMPARTPGNSRLAQLLYSLDSAIRARS